eukprot:5193940-Prorocentrum_lima.AAC.1
MMAFVRSARGPRGNGTRAQRESVKNSSGQCMCVFPPCTRKGPVDGVCVCREDAAGLLQGVNLHSPAGKHSQWSAVRVLRKKRCELGGSPRGSSTRRYFRALPGTFGACPCR